MRSKCLSLVGWVDDGAQTNAHQTDAHTAGRPNSGGISLGASIQEGMLVVGGVLTGGRIVFFLTADVLYLDALP